VLTIDGSKGEGGGHVVRTALALSLATGKPFVLEKIRGLRTSPGLQRAHLAALDAAEKVGRARVEGASLESTRIAFTPGAVLPGQYRFSVGGSAVLLAQTILPALIRAGGPSELVVEGGTLYPTSPAYDLFAESYLSILRKLGAKVRIELWRHGFSPEAGGAFRVFISPSPLAPITIAERGRLLARRAVARMAQLPTRLGDRQVAVLEARLRWGKPAYTVEEVESKSAGNVVLVTMRHENATHVDSQLHDPEQAVEVAAHMLANRLDLFLSTAAPIGPWLADQILVPFALAGGGSFVTIEPTRHTWTTIDVVHAFLPELRIDARDNGDRTWTVSVRRA
jgi:RNA 3'-terminal phosphate cyclase (ATP)